MGPLVQEIRHAARRLVRAPVFACAAVLTLALAIAANAAIFAVVKRVVLDPLPYPESDRLFELDHGSQRLNFPAGFGTTAGLYFHYVERARGIERAALHSTGDLTLTGDGEPERIRVSHVTPSLSSVLRVSPALGRWLTETDGEPGASKVAVLSHAFWTRRYHRDPGVVGRPVALGGAPTEIIGVMPPTFVFPDARVDAWSAEQVTRAMGFGLWNYKSVARLRDGITFDAARVELNQLIADVPQAFPGDMFAIGNIQTNLVFSGRTLKEATLGNVTRALWTLLASVGVLLLVACANVANLFLVRSDARQREIAVRRALGASRSAIARYFLTESALLSLIGGALGLTLAWGAVRLLVTFGPANLPRLGEVQLDPVSIAFTFGLSLVTALLFGAIPLRRGARLSTALQESGRANTASRQRHRVRHLLMAAQTALALVLLLASALMLRSFQKLRAVDPGFDPSSALTVSIALPDRQYATREAAVRAHHAIVDRFAALPGVTGVSATSCLPLSGGCMGNTVLVEGRPRPEGTIPPVALYRAVAGGYFETIGMRMLRGRGITRDDVERREPVVVISDLFAKRFFPDQDPIGKRVASNRPPKPGEPLDWLTIVGVVANTPLRTLAERDALPQLYMPMSIAGGPDIPQRALVGPNIAVMSYVIRTSTPPLDLLPAIRRNLDAVDRDLPIAAVSTLQAMLDRASAQMAFTMVLIAIAATVALILGVVGIYGVMSYIVTQRTGEIGVRLALGASPRSVAGQIVRQGGLVSLGGILIGLGVALAGGRLIESLLYGVSSRDPIVYAGTTFMLVTVALAACWLPARRAAQLNPVEALRVE